MGQECRGTGDCINWMVKPKHLFEITKCGKGFWWNVGGLYGKQFQWDVGGFTMEMVLYGMWANCGKEFQCDVGGLCFGGMLVGYDKGFWRFVCELWQGVLVGCGWPMASDFGDLWMDYGKGF